MAKRRPPSKASAIILDGASLTLNSVLAIARGASLRLGPGVKKVVEAGRTTVKSLLQTHRPIYGVNTGFGYLANRLVAPSQLKALQKNIVRSHAAGHGHPLSLSETRLAMALRLNVLAQGHTGVRYELCDTLLRLITHEIYPVIPDCGSVGASGDLAPLAHLALPLIGEGRVHYQGRIVPAMEALLDAEIEPLELVEKEGLGLINGTQIMLSVGGLALAKARLLLDKADLIASLTFEAAMGNPVALDERIHAARGQVGQLESARQMRSNLNGSYLYRRGNTFLRVQDPYSLRCAPQVHGASRDAIAYCSRIVEIELNASTDNPLVFSDTQEILSGGNFHGQPLAYAFDMAAIALSELANIADRRLEVLCNPHLSGLPAFLSPNPGVESGYMATQYLSASLVNENKLLANPSSTDSIPGNVGIEDHVSMGMTAARKLKRLLANVEVVLAIELMAAAQAVDLRKSRPLADNTQRAYEALRSLVPFLDQDRIVAEDIEGAVRAIYEL